jgi:CheY-like chemotaxis protein
MSQKPPQILIVDDEPDLCWVLESVLRPAGYGVTTTTSGAEALKVAGDTYTVAFVDAKLPDMDGLELAGAIRRRSPHTAIILISGYFYPEDRAISQGLADNLIADFVAKPFALEDIRVVARQAIERTRSGRP